MEPTLDSTLQIGLSKKLGGFFKKSTFDVCK